MSLLPDTPAPAPSPSRPAQYVVVARRYRPQTFDELLGQEHVAKALSNAIATSRVGHAYLFTGARGVGKTSAARILAKALNCEQGPTAAPCNTCDICRSIASGEDVDVLEIDGASNRGIDEIRQLRQNVNVRPSRARYKIYIIDEVHMLTREAFNALLKTLEEPPEHVKFIFCTTEAQKIPITILSRCQRYDFAGIDTGAIAARLRQICQTEGVEAEAEALDLLARRAAGSMRDSQSLLEQLLSFCPGTIGLADVHEMLGTAADEYLASMVGDIIARDPAAMLARLDAALGQGVDVTQLLEQLLGYLRDCLVIAAGGDAGAMLFSSAAGREKVVEAGQRLGVQNLLAAMQILDQALSRMRYSTQGRILAELALVRIATLEDLEELGALLEQLRSGVPTSPPGPSAGRTTVPPPESKKKAEPVLTVPAETAAPPPGVLATERATVERAAVERAAGEVAEPSLPPANARPLSAETATAVWSAALDTLSGMVVGQARLFERVVYHDPDRLAVVFKPSDGFARSMCQRQEYAARFDQAVSQVVGRRIRVEFELSGAEAAAPTPPAASPHQRWTEAMQNPLVRRACELFGAQPQRPR